MERYTDIAIDPSFVIHVLDNRVPMVQCSQALTPFPQGLRTTLERYLLGLLRPGFRRKEFARFQAESPVLQVCQRLTASAQSNGGINPTTFLEVSRIPHRLFTAMRQVPQNGAGNRPGEITPGDLLVGTFFSDAPEMSRKPYLFLIKVDLESGLQRQIQPLATGGMQTVLMPCEGLLPPGPHHSQLSATPDVVPVDHRLLLDILVVEGLGVLGRDRNAGSVELPMVVRLFRRVEGPGLGVIAD